MSVSIHEKIEAVSKSQALRVRRALVLSRIALVPSFQLDMDLPEVPTGYADEAFKEIKDFLRMRISDQDADTVVTGIEEAVSGLGVMNNVRTLGMQALDDMAATVLEVSKQPDMSAVEKAVRQARYEVSEQLFQQELDRSTALAVNADAADNSLQVIIDTRANKTTYFMNPFDWEGTQSVGAWGDPPDAHVAALHAYKASIAGDFAQSTQRMSTLSSNKQTLWTQNGIYENQLDRLKANAQRYLQALLTGTGQEAEYWETLARS